MKNTKAFVIRTIVVVVAVLAIFACAFLLFVKPLVAQKNAAPATTDESTSNTKRQAVSVPVNPTPLMDGTYTSVVTPTHYGDMKLSVTFKDHAVSKVTVLTSPDKGDKSKQINKEALPILIKDAEKKKSAELQFITGATTSVDAFANSLQDTINQARAAAVHAAEGK